MKLAWTALMAAALVFGSQGAMGQAQTETFEVDFSNPGLAPSHWKLVLHPDGSGHFSSSGGNMPGNDSDLKAPPVDRDIEVSKAFAEQVFETAYHHKLFNQKCESDLRVAFQGIKKISYSGPKGEGACSFNYSKDKDIQALGESVVAVEQTIMEGARLELLLKHDPLGLDHEMSFLVQAAKDGRMQQICVIKGILGELAGNPEVLERVRQWANLLLRDSSLPERSRI